MTTRERKAMSLLKNILDEYNSLSLTMQTKLSNTGLEVNVNKIASVLKMFKSDIGKEISVGVEVSGINERFDVAIDMGEVVVIERNKKPLFPYNEIEVE